MSKKFKVINYITIENNKPILWDSLTIEEQKKLNINMQKTAISKIGTINKIISYEK